MVVLLLRPPLGQCEPPRQSQNFTRHRRAEGPRFEAAAISYAADVGATGCSVAPGGARPLIWAALLICFGLRRQRRRERVIPIGR